MSSAQPELGPLNWRKARRSMNHGDCVEVAASAEVVAVRDSRDQDGPVMPYSGKSWRTFLAGVQAGQFDLERLPGK